MKQPVVLVCGRLGPEKLFPDNLTGRCAVCGSMVEYRPKPPKRFELRCGLCAMELFEPGDEIEVTQRALDEVVAYLRKKQQ